MKIGHQLFDEIPTITIKSGKKVGGQPGNTNNSTGNPLYVKGNQLAKAENLSADANNRRLQGTLKSIHVNARKRAGYNVVTKKMKKRRKERQRLRLKITTAKEAREIMELCRTHAVAGVERMAKIINDPHSMDSVAVAAFIAITERAYGKASQTNVNANVNVDGKKTQVTDQELDTRIAETLKRVEAIAGRTPVKAPSPKQPVDLRKLN